MNDPRTALRVLVANLLDHWEQIPNDFMTALQEECPEVCNIVRQLQTKLRIEK